SSIEVFGDNGRFVMTNLVFPNEPYSTLSVKTEGGTSKIANFRIYSIK
ncbi:MAG: GH32 C-terminal domain-containing protein, partial [Duncaniella sp.]|nr:GH32 C-terminal domain-containing protein [Duncaniella sp.]